MLLLEDDDCICKDYVFCSVLSSCKRIVNDPILSKCRTKSSSPLESACIKVITRHIQKQSDIKQLNLPCYLQEKITFETMKPIRRNFYILEEYQKTHDKSDLPWIKKIKLEKFFDEITIVPKFLNKDDMTYVAEAFRWLKNLQSMRTDFLLFVRLLADLAMINLLNTNFEFVLLNEIFNPITRIQEQRASDIYNLSRPISGYLWLTYKGNHPYHFVNHKVSKLYTRYGSLRWPWYKEQFSRYFNDGEDFKTLERIKFSCSIDPLLDYCLP